MRHITRERSAKSWSPRTLSLVNSRRASCLIPVTRRKKGELLRVRHVHLLQFDRQRLPDETIELLLLCLVCCRRVGSRRGRDQFHARTLKARIPSNISLVFTKKSIVPDRR